VSTAPPTGTSSFFFTDVAGSTRLWETDEKGMAASLKLAVKTFLEWEDRLVDS